MSKEYGHLLHESADIRPVGKRIEATAKRVIDLVAAGILLIALSPVIVAVAVLIAVSMKRPIVFAQIRPGLDERLFKIYKFRTMTNARDSAGNLLPSAKRVTRLGRILRKTSLDELPQLLNVIMGSLSIVGPRPLLVDYLERYTAEQRRRHTVKPGITGYAQISGRNRISWEEKFKLDVWYVDHWSLWLDAKIACMTVWKVIKREGACPPDSATMRRFQGSASAETRLEGGEPDDS